MNKLRIFAGFCLLAAIVLLAPACSNGVITTEEDFKDFTSLDIQNAFDVQVIKSDTYAVTITSSEALVDYLSVTKQGNTLTIRMSPNHPFTDFALMRKVLKARITMPALDGIDLSGASKANVTGFESTNPLRLNISGASELRLGGVETGDGDFEVSGASDLKGKLTAADVKFNVSGASHVELDGTAENVQLTGSGASKLSLEQFVHQTATVTLSGASQATVDTRKRLDFSLSGASQFYFLSNPVTGKMEVLGASTVKHK